MFLDIVNKATLLLEVVSSDGSAASRSSGLFEMTVRAVHNFLCKPEACLLGVVERALAPERLAVARKESENIVNDVDVQKRLL
jgi:hypothetical protein